MIAIDTNVLAYAEGIDDDKRRVAARALMRGLPGDAVVIPVQVLGELFNVLVRRGWRMAQAQAAISAWRVGYGTAPTTDSAMVAAMDLATDHHLHIWDSVMISVAAEAGCHMLLSEDMQPGFTWHGVTVVNPFATTPHPLLASLQDLADDKE
jgi:predicted nucleic acid-binding protein